MSDSKKITLTIMGKKRELTLEELTELYRQIDDPDPDRRARESFETHSKRQARAEQLKKANSSPEELYKFVYGEFEHVYGLYETGFEYWVGPIPEDVFKAAEGLTIEQLKDIQRRCSEKEHIQRLQEIIDKKEKSDREERTDDGKTDEEK